jgi:hypothetical protein
MSTGSPSFMTRLGAAVAVERIEAAALATSAVAANFFT